MSKANEQGQKADRDSTIAEPSTAQQSGQTEDDDWTAVTDPSERRKIQNRIAQRKFREKVRQQREESERSADNQRNAAGSYTTPEPEHCDTNEEGLPWGGISMRHVISTGRTKEQSSQQSSAQAGTGRGGGSSRIGLLLIDHYARDSPAWAQWRYPFTPFVQDQQQLGWEDMPG